MPRRSAAFTLVELLVCIAIIGVMVALLLPAVQSAREAARRAQCAQHLTNLILGVHQYEQAHLLYPPGTLAKKSPVQNLPNDLHHNWIGHLLPHVEQQNTHRNLDLSVSIYDPKNAAVLAATPKLLTCPSSAGRNAGYSEYAAAHHDVEAPIDEQNSGVFYLNSKLAYDDLEDGVANTLFLAEKIPDSFDLGWLSGTRATLRNGSTGFNQLLYRHGLPRINYGSGFEPPGTVKEGDQPRAMNQSNVSSEPDANGQISLPPLGTNPSFVGGFASMHHLGLNCAFGDGNVRFVSDNVPASLVHALIHRKDGKLAQQP